MQSHFSKNWWIYYKNRVLKSYAATMSYTATHWIITRTQKGGKPRLFSYLQPFSAPSFPTARIHRQRYGDSSPYSSPKIPAKNSGRKTNSSAPNLRPFLIKFSQKRDHRKVARSSWLAKGKGKNCLLQGLHLVATRRISIADCDKE